MYQLRIFFAFLIATPKTWGSIQAGDYDPKYGTYIGKLSTLWHDVTGDVYAVDNITIHIRNFNYDGEAPDAYFFAGNRTPQPSNRGFIIPDERGNTYPLGPYKNRNLVLKFPITKSKGQRSFNDIKWFSVWCEQYAIDFGHVLIPKDLKWPNPMEAGAFTNEKPLVKASAVVLEDTETLQIQDLTYDGSVSDAIFVMGGGDANADGHQVPNERGSISPLDKYNRKTVTLNLPKESLGHIQYFGIWSPTQGMISSVTFPQDMRVPPSRNSLR